MITKPCLWTSLCPTIVLIILTTALPLARCYAEPPPSARLQPLVTKIGPALAIYDLPNGNNPPVVKAPAAKLKADFVAQRPAASPNGQQRLDAGIYVCDTILAAVDEKHALRERMNRSGAFRGKKIGSKKGGPQGNEKLFADDILADWKERRTELVAQVNQAFTKLKAIEAATQK